MEVLKNLKQVKLHIEKCRESLLFALKEIERLIQNIEESPPNS